MANKPASAADFTKQTKMKMKTAKTKAHGKEKHSKHDDNELAEIAKRYLKDAYNEDTLKMKVLKNHVNFGNGTLDVECTVKGGLFKITTTWQKQFIFEDGKITDMTAERKKDGQAGSLEA